MSKKQRKKREINIFEWFDTEKTERNQNSLLPLFFTVLFEDISEPIPIYPSIDMTGNVMQLQNAPNYVYLFLFYNLIIAYFI